MTMGTSDGGAWVVRQRAQPQAGDTIIDLEAIKTTQKLAMGALVFMRDNGRQVSQASWKAVKDVGAVLAALEK